MQETGNRFFAKVSSRGFLLKDIQTGHSSDWMDAGSVFTAMELKMPYASACISLFTPSVTLVPSSFSRPENERQLLSSVASVPDRAAIHRIELPEYDAVLLWADEESLLATAIAEALRVAGCGAVRTIPELYRLMELLPGIPSYNKVLCSYDGLTLFIVVAEGRNLRLCSSFAAPDFTTAEYWIFNAVRSFQMNMEVTDVFFATPLTQEEEISMCCYFKSVEMLF